MSSFKFQYNKRKKKQLINKTKMANLTLFTSLLKFGHVARNATSTTPRIFLATAPRRIQASSSQQDAASVANEARNAAENVTQTTKDMAGKVSATAQDVSEKAKQTAQDAWSQAKGTAQKAADTVVGKTEESKEFVKENAEQVKKSMNTKNKN
ncbi:PREDICTED: late [Prunus dulcis]|uniref:PREDICTED: late n=2 Tax=Prunus dulcis TaxID=3755 RepID=A0A5E4EDM1_PRUDU|nr:PREDICTED: late [Prunus dulcis]